AAMPAERLGAGLDPPAAAGDGLSADPHPGAVVATEETLGVGDRHLAPRLPVGGHRLGDLSAGGAGSLVELAQQLRLARGGDLTGRALDRLRASPLHASPQERRV